ncbi:MAG: VWA domain-containing protein [Clostridia bacterium]|nr:VWA domain-containing protein [Clostridia bacterium]
MSNFTINFSNPWLLFLLIPAAALIVIAIMRVPKKYRNTRNRVVSVTLEAIVLLCAILVLSGMTFSYVTGNTQNEILLLVDVTETMDQCAETRDEYIEEILYRGEDEGCQVGVVTFGFTQVYAAPLSTDAEKVYSQYKSAALPDTSATDLAAAMEYACKLYTNPETSKMIIISDGKETDESALSAISMVSSQGTVVESVYIPSAYEGCDIQIVDAEMPDYHVSTGDAFDVTLEIESNYEGPVTLYVTDNGKELELFDENGNSDGGERELSQGKNTLTFRCRVYDKYLHAIRITISDIDEEILTQNNSYCVYLYIDNYNKILIFESSEGESENLIETLYGKEAEDISEGELAYEIYTVTLSEDFVGTEGYALPLSVDELRQYDLIILNNTSNANMYDAYCAYIENLGRMEEFYSYFYKTGGTVKSGGGLLPQLLYTYVYNYGGGLLTCGGVSDEADDDGNLVANMYSRSDMYGTVLQQMIPVTAINYTPPTGVVVIIDTSGSMGSGDGSLLNLAILGVLQSLDLLSVRDYMGIIEFSSEPHVLMSLTSLTNKSYIQASLNNLIENPQSEGTVLAPSLSEAISMLNASQSLYERKHIIVVSDGIIYDVDDCVTAVEGCPADGITVSSIVVGGGTDGINNMSAILDVANDGNIDDYLYDCSTTNTESKVGEYIYEDIQATVWAEVNYETVDVQVASGYTFSSLLDGLFAVKSDGSTDWTRINASVTRFYGTTIKSGASLILTGDYSVPLYAQWSYGEGMVGSLMCDVTDFGDLEDNILITDSEEGQKLIINIVDNLMPTEDIRPSGISVALGEDNYTNRLSVYADMEDASGNPYTVDARIYRCDEGEEVEVLNLGVVTGDIDEDTMYYVTVAMDESNNYSRANFVIKEPGVYKIVVQLLDSDGNVVENDMSTPATATLYKEFSYSAEYDTYGDFDGLALMNSLSTGEFGGAIKDSDDLVYVYSGLVTRITRTVDPTLALIIIALVLFLLGIAVRKFKWKWPHELVRERKVAKENKV